MKRRFGKQGKKIAVVLALFLGMVLCGCAKDSSSRPALQDPFSMNSPEYAIGVPQSAAATTVVEQAFPRCKIFYFQSLADGYVAVTHRKIDAFAFDRHALQYAVAKQPELAVLDKKVADELIVIGAARGREDLIGKVNEYIRRYRQDGTYADMYNRWILGQNLTMPDLPKPVHPARTLKIGTTGVNEPMNFYAGNQLTGFDIEFAQRLAYHLNVQCEFSTIEYPAIVAAAQTGKIDLLIANLNATPERRKIMLFSDPYIDSEISFLVRKDRLAVKEGQAITDVSQLAGKNVGVQTGTTYETVLKEQMPSAVPQYFTTFTDQIEAVKSGKISAFLADEVVAKSMIRQTSGITYLKPWLRSDDYAFAFNQQQLLLQKEVNAVLEQMKKDGTLRKLEEKWFGDQEEAKMLPDVQEEGKNGSIRFATNSDSAPFVFIKNGKPVGFDIEVAMMVAAKLGRKLHILDMDFAAIIPSLVSGKTDMAGDFISVTPERAKSVLFSVPYYTGGTVAVVAAGSSVRAEGGLKSLSELTGKKIGIITGSTFDHVLKSRNPGAIHEYFNNFSDQIEALKSGKIAAFLIDEPMARDILNRTDGVSVLKELLTSDGYAFAFSKNQARLRQDVNAALREMKENGLLKQIDARWFGTDEAAKVLPSLAGEGKNGVIRMATNSGMAPFAYLKNGKLVGYDIEIAMRIAAKVGRRLEISDQETSSIIPSLISGKSDMAACGITVTAERAKSLLFSDPNYQGGIAVMVAAGADEPDAIGNGGWGSELMKSFERTFLVENRYLLVLKGLQVTILITVFSAIFGTILGFGVCLMRRAETHWANMPARIFIRAIQGTPIVVLLMILYYVVFGSVDINAMVVAVVGFSINFAAYVSEMMRTGIDAVDKGQHEAAYALGFNRLQVFTKITFPQAARHVLPVYKGEFISMLKMTSVVGYIAVQDLTKMSDIIRSRTYEAFFPLIATALIYFGIAYVGAHFLSRIEMRIDPKSRKRIVKGVGKP